MKKNLLFYATPAVICLFSFITPGPEAFAQRYRQTPARDAADTGIEPPKNFDGHRGENPAFRERFLKTADIIVAMREPLRLTGEQIAAMQKLGSEFKRTVISKDGEIESLTVEMNTLAWEDPFNIEGINALAMKRHERIVERDKYILDAYDKLNSILTDEQKKAFKDLRY